MIKLKADDRQRILTIEVEGMISEADLDRAMEALQADYPAVGVHLRGGERGFRMLIDWERLEGWEKGAKTVGTLLGRMVGDAARKVAVIADARWADEEERLADVAKQAAIRFFPPSEREQALSWVTAP
jgi:Protein of unknown function (DUF3478).